MRRWLAITAVAGAGVGAVMLLRRRRSSGYTGDAIDAAGQGESFGERGGNAPEQRWAPAETRTDVTPEQLSAAAKVGVSAGAIQSAWPAVTEDEIDATEGNLDRLARLIAEKTEQPVEQVRRRLDGILAEQAPIPSYPAH